MKNLINDLIRQSGLNNNDFAIAVGTSASYLSQRKRQKSIDIQLLVKWAQMFDIKEINSYDKLGTVKIVLNNM